MMFQDDLVGLDEGGSSTPKLKVDHFEFRKLHDAQGLYYIHSCNCFTIYTQDDVLTCGFWSIDYEGVPKVDVDILGEK